MQYESLRKIEKMILDYTKKSPETFSIRGTMNEVIISFLKKKHTHTQLQTKNYKRETEKFPYTSITRKKKNQQITVELHLIGKELNGNVAKRNTPSERKKKCRHRNSRGRTPI